MVKYYRLELKETNTFIMMWIMYFLGSILLWDHGWKFIVFVIVWIFSVILTSIKLKVIKKRD